MDAGEIVLPIDAPVPLMVHSQPRTVAEVISSRRAIGYLCNTDNKVLPNGDPVGFAAIIHNHLPPKPSTDQSGGDDRGSFRSNTAYC